jgi:hypothetical protein
MTRLLSEHESAKALDALKAAAHRCGIENENVTTDIERMELALANLRTKRIRTSLAALQAQLAVEQAS